MKYAEVRKAAEGHNRLFCRECNEKALRELKNE